jgi:hypothetical protein
MIINTQTITIRNYNNYVQQSLRVGTLNDHAYAQRKLRRVTFARRV